MNFNDMHWKMFEATVEAGLSNPHNVLLQNAIGMFTDEQVRAAFADFAEDTVFRAENELRFLADVADLDADADIEQFHKDRETRDGMRRDLRLVNGDDH